MLRFRRSATVLPLAIALIAAACPRSQTASAPPAAPSSAPAQQPAIAGDWIHREMPVRYAETMSLAVAGERVTGTGTFMMEGGRTGKTAIAGTWRGGTLTLDVTRDTGMKERWTGHLADGRLTGTLTIDGDSRPFGFERPQP